VSEVQKYNPKLYIGVIGSKYFNYLPTSKNFVVGNWMVIPYLVLFCWLLPRMGFVKKAGMGSKMVMGLFLIKAFTGFALGWLSYRYTNSDYWQQNGWGWDEYQLLLRNPGEYFTNLFRSGYAHGFDGVLDSTNSYWNDLKTNLIVKLISVFDIFSQGNYYINSIFFSAIGFMGHTALYRVFIKLYPLRRWAVVVGCFLLPSMLLYSSAVHKDPIMFACIGLLCVAVYQWHATGRPTVKLVLTMLFTLGILFLLRNLVFLAAFAALAASFCVWVTKWKPLPVFAGVYLLGAFLFFNAGHIMPSLNIPARMVEKQGFFLAYPKVKTVIPMDTLRPTALGFLRNTPQAVNHALMRPYILEGNSRVLVPIAVEFLAYQLLFILFLFFPRRTDMDAAGKAFLLFGLFFAFTNLLSIGYIVNNLGSIVRYRSLYLGLLVTPLLAGINWERIKQYFILKK
jgi:hypothetical protein